jgi:hypothetical protein
MKREYDRYVDSEGVVHLNGPGIAVNSGLCGNNDNNCGETDAPADCAVCFAIVKHVGAHRMPKVQEPSA